MLIRAFAAAKQVSDDFRKIKLLGTMVEHLSPKESGALIAGALAAAEGITHGAGRAIVLAAIAKWLAPEQRLRVLARALEAVEAIAEFRAPARDPTFRKSVENAYPSAPEFYTDFGITEGHAVAAIATSLSTDQDQELLTRTLAAVERISGHGDQATALAAISNTRTHCS